MATLPPQPGFWLNAGITCPDCDHFRAELRALHATVAAERCRADEAVAVNRELLAELEHWRKGER